MKNILQKEIIKRLKTLGLSQQYNLLGLINNNLNNGVVLQNRMLSFSPFIKDQAMREIRLALTLGPDKIDF